ncbi:hypothetical protein V6N13_080851 [Hibiscus sabdariffa]
MLLPQQSAAFKILRTRLKTVPSYSFNGDQLKQAPSGNPTRLILHQGCDSLSKFSNNIVCLQQNHNHETVPLHYRRRCQKPKNPGSLQLLTQIGPLRDYLSKA